MNSTLSKDIDRNALFFFCAEKYSAVKATITLSSPIILGANSIMTINGAICRLAAYLNIETTGTADHDLSLRMAVVDLADIKGHEEVPISKLIFIEDWAFNDAVRSVFGFERLAFVFIPVNLTAVLNSVFHRTLVVTRKRKEPTPT